MAGDPGKGYRPSFQMLGNLLSSFHIRTLPVGRSRCPEYNCLVVRGKRVTRSCKIWCCYFFLPSDLGVSHKCSVRRIGSSMTD